MEPYQRDGREGIHVMDWDFSKMSSTTLFSLALLAVLVLLLVVLIIVTIKVLSKGKKGEDDEYTERRYTSREEDADTSEDSSDDDDDDDDEDDDEDERESGGDSEESKPEVKDEVAAVVEAALQAKAKAAELEARVAKEKADQAREEAERAAEKANRAEEEAKAAAEKAETERKEAQRSEEPEEAEEDPDEEDDEDLEHTDEIPVARIRHELEKQKKDADVMKATTRVADADQIIEAVKEAKGRPVSTDEETLLAEEAAEVMAAVAATEAAAGKSAAEDSAFGDSAFAVDPGERDKTLETSFDSAFTDAQLHQEIEGRKDELADSAFAVTEETKEEEVKPLQVSGETITVNPVNAVNITTVNAVAPVDTSNPEAGIKDAAEMSAFMQDNPVPKKKKKKMKKKDVAFAKKFDSDGPKIETARYLWYNNQDIETLTKKEDMYYYCHYFDDPAKAVLPLIIEMYDCAFVRTEEIQKIAYGIQYKSMGLREILTAKDDVSFDRSRIAKEPTEQDLLQIRAKWCDYVDNFLQIIEIQAPEEMQDYIRDQLYAYSENDVDTLLYCPEPEEDED